MDKQQLGKLERALNAEFWLTIEVANGITTDKIQRKIDQAVRKARLLSELLESGPEVRTCLMFSNNDNVRNYDFGIDLIVQMPNFIKTPTHKAFESISHRRKIKPYNQFVQEILYQLSKGKDLKKMFYLRDGWDQFRKEFPRLAKLSRAGTREEYYNHVSDLKYLFLEEYARCACRQAMPNTYVPPSAIRLTSGNTTEEIDLIVIGKRKTILAGLHNPTYFAVTPPPSLPPPALPQTSDRETPREIPSPSSLSPPTNPAPPSCAAYAPQETLPFPYDKQAKQGI